MSMTNDAGQSGGGGLFGSLLNMLLGNRTDGGAAKPMLPNAGTVVPSLSTAASIKDATDLANGGKIGADGNVIPPPTKTQNTKPQVDPSDIMDAITKMQKQLDGISAQSPQSDETAAHKGFKNILQMLGGGTKGAGADAANSAAQGAAGTAASGASNLSLIMKLFS